ncbi:MAG: hypothetical protein O2807_05140 [bacterium]|nr:hypothetical protein [bacterium]
MFDDFEHRDEYKRIVEGIQILRRPYTGIIAGYHELAYHILGPEAEAQAGSVHISGQLMVSPKLVWSPTQVQKTFGELFSERELMDSDLVGRVFAFPNVVSGHFNVENDRLKVVHHELSPDRIVEKVLDDLDRREVTDAGVVRTSNIRYYPIAVQRFIREILGEEFT